MYESNPRGAHALPPRADPGAFAFFLFLFRSNSPPCGPFHWSNAPLPRYFLGVKCPAPRAEVTRPRLISGNLNVIFNTAISIIFCIPVQRLRSSFFSVYITTTQGLGTSSVRSEHCNRLFQVKKKSKSTNQYILNFVTQECFQNVRYHQTSTIGKEANPS